MRRPKMKPGSAASPGRRALPAAALAVLAIAVAPGGTGPASACTVFALVDSGGVVYGQNLDWLEPVPGQVVVNRRGVRKSVLHWKGGWPAPDARPEVSWVSEYGSVTFTCYGRDFIDGGMNEAGLVVDETNMVAEYPPDDGRTGVSCTQWMQYQLDRFASVAEVLAHLGDLRPDGEGWHYLVADAGGTCAVIEYDDGSPLVFTGDSLVIPALTNTGYRQALSHVPMDESFGGDIDIAAGDDSYGRFVRVAAWMRDRVRAGGASLPDDAFGLLREVGSGVTRRSVVYDAVRRRVTWVTPANPGRRWLDLDSLDFGFTARTRVVDVDEGGPGDVSRLLADYSPEANLATARAVLGGEGPAPGTPPELRARGMTREDAIRLVARHPTLQ